MSEILQIIPITQFGSVEFAKLNLAYFNEYVTYRIHGYDERLAFRRVFGKDQMDQHAYEKIDEIEHNPWVRAEMARRLKEVKASELWNERIAIHELLCLVRGYEVRDTVRNKAIADLNVLYGITIVDDKGQTRRGMSLDEFYQAHGTPAPGSPNANPVLNEDGKAPTLQ